MILVAFQRMSPSPAPPAVPVPAARPRPGPGPAAATAAALIVTSFAAVRDPLEFLLESGVVVVPAPHLLLLLV